MDRLKEAIDERKASLWYKVQKMFGGGKDVNDMQMKYWRKKEEAGYFNEDRMSQAEREKDAAGKMGALMIEHYNNEISKMEDVVIDEAWHDKARASVAEFYGKQGEIKKDWEEGQKERSVAENASKHNVLFLHGIPFESAMASTSINNSSLDTNSMSSEEKALFLAGLEPTISVSSKTLDSAKAEKMPTRELMYNTGFILGGGEIMSAAENDNGTEVESLDVKTYGGDSAVQPNIAEKITKAVGSEERKEQSMTTWNEFVVKKPKIAGMYILEGAENEKLAIPEMQKLAGELGVPIIHLSRDGKMWNLTEDRETTAEEVMAVPKEFSTEEKIAFIERTKKFVNAERNPKMAEEIEKRLADLKEDKTPEEKKRETERKISDVHEKIENAFET